MLAATRGRSSFERPKAGSAPANNPAIRLPGSACPSGARVHGGTVIGGSAGVNGDSADVNGASSMRLTPGEIDEHAAALREPWGAESPGSPRGSGPQMSAAVLAMVFGRRCSDMEKTAHAQEQEPSRPSTVQEQVQRRCSSLPSSEDGDADARLSAGSPGASPSAWSGFKPPALSRDGSRDSNHSFYSQYPGPADLREAWRNDAVYGGDTPRGERPGG